MKNQFEQNGESPLVAVTIVKNESDIEEYFKFADPIIGVEWGSEGRSQEYTPEYIAAHPDFTQVFLVRNRNNEIIGGAKVKKIGEFDKHRLGLDKGILADEKGALLEYTAIAEEYRNKRLLQTLTDERIKWAQRAGVSYVCAEAEITNPISIYAKIRDGFVLVGIQEPGEGIIEPYFVEVKYLGRDPAFLNKNSAGKTWKEILVNRDSYGELRSLFSDGWIGVDIKGKTGSEADLEVPWTLVMERYA